MRLLSLVSLAALTSFASAEYFVVHGPFHYLKAEAACHAKGGHLARIKAESKRHRYLATKALSNAGVHEAFIRPPSKSVRKFPHVLRKPGDFKNSKARGKIFQLQCDSDKVCRVFLPALCYGKGIRDPNRKLDKSGGYKKKRHNRKYRWEATYRDDSYGYVEDNGCEGDSCFEAPEREYVDSIETYEPPTGFYEEPKLLGRDYY